MIPEKVLKNFTKKYQLPSSEAVKIFGELECFLSNANGNRIRPTKETDKAWHTFILHTQEYSKYCIDKFGRFIHHVPDNVEDAKNSENCSSSDCSSNCAPN